MAKGVYVRTPEILEKQRVNRSWYRPSEETRRKISASKIGKKRPWLSEKYARERELYKDERRARKLRQDGEWRDRWRLVIRERQREYMRAHKVKYNSKARERYARVRIDVLSHYSNGALACACCGERELMFLCLDHINGVEKEHKIDGRYRRSGAPLYSWIFKNNYPSGFQVLCHNCNLAKGFYGACPHKH